MDMKFLGVIATVMIVVGLVMANGTNPDADTTGNLQDVPPFIEEKWELYDEDPELGGIQIYYDDMPVDVIKCAAVCDDNSIDNVICVDAVIVHDATGNVVDNESCLSMAEPAHCTGTFECREVLHKDQCDLIPGCYSDICSGGFCCQGTPEMDCNDLYEYGPPLRQKCDGLVDPEADLPSCTFVPDDDCWATVDHFDPEFRDKYKEGLCELFTGTFTMNPDLPAVIDHPPGWYTVTVTATDQEGNTGSLSNQYEYKSVTISKPKVIKKWEISELDTDDRGEVTPIACDTNTVTKCAVVMDSDGVDDIAEVTATVTDPDGNLYDFEYLELDTAGLCDGSPELNQPEVLDCLASNTCAVYSGTFDMLYNDTPGTYTVVVGGKDQGGIPAITNTNTFIYNELVILDLDTDTVDFGSLIPDQISWVYGDFDMSTLDAPTIKNCGNVVIDVDVDVSDMFCTTPDTCDGDFIPESRVDQHLDACSWTGFGDHCYDDADLNPAATTNLDVSAHPQLGLLPGNYQGDIVATALADGGCP